MLNQIVEKMNEELTEFQASKAFEEIAPWQSKKSAFS
jgi:predicted house-cleaning noncanonical NTP pyrophosphatase (MazG superfamily)